MRKLLLLVVGCALVASGLSAQGKPVLVISSFAPAAGVDLPYDMKLLQTQLVAEFKVILGKQFEIVSAPAPPSTSAYTLNGEITGWRPGNAAKRLLVGMGSGREASDIAYKLTDGAGKAIIERTDTIRTNFYSQSAGSTGTLAHPIAQKISDRIKAAKLK